MEKKVGDPLSQTTEDLWTEDETTVRLGTIQRRVLAPCGSRPVIKIRIGRYSKRVNVFISLSRKGQVVVTLVIGLDAKATKRHLREVRRTNGPGPIILIWDGSGAHHAKTVKKYCQKKGIRLEYFPPHSPEVNPVEEINRQLKDFLATRLFWTVKELKQVIKQFFEDHNYHFDLKIEEYICSQEFKSLQTQLEAGILFLPTSESEGDAQEIQTHAA